jgi:predicted 2-oxoglutarate/Fe(II)-dependent dioxygenase YbiX
MFYKLIENFLSKKECDYLIDLGESLSLTPMKSSKIINGKLINEDYEWHGNKRMGNYFVDTILLKPEVKLISEKVLSLSNALSPYNGLTYNSIPKYSFNRYSDGDFLDWHKDKHEVLNGATITHIIQLNSDYEGGCVRYIIEGVEYSVPKIQGSVFVFDSNIPHSVDVIKSGNRYSINVWPGSIKKLSII